ncbi:conjugal transfer protein [Aeromicrobium sp. PE09-221]|uniref:MobF family relaxase n=1 Tax=Aeromicrobium sp. PE09-221 TaxID=1898043 RepID=UPI000B741A33|nr:MobF family relaxase [Aeromicrobium sp. PE09-221]OUZ11124.1 conjugal transfer protein [Aeromicrobium sp. PE09-221]
MTVSMKSMSAGDGYKYLLKSVIAGDGNRALSTPMTRYYAEAGTPPGRWLGSGVATVGGGLLRVGDPVSGEQLAWLIGMGRDPVTGDQLGRAFPQYATVAHRIAARVAGLSADLSAPQRNDVVAQIESEERERGEQRAVAGFDFTFSVPKSVSVLWGVADAGTQALIVEAHHASVADVMDLLERELATTRRGVDAGNGAVMQADVAGIIAATFDHWDSRLGDPQLHTHVVISNKVKTAADGRWRSLDSRPLHAGVVAMSEHYNAVLADRITRRFGLGWVQRERGKDRNPSWELAHVPDLLIRAFSSRSRAIELEKDRLVGEYTDARGKRPSKTTVIRLRAQATLATRPEKHIRSLADLTDEWRDRADQILHENSLAWACRLTDSREARRTLRADDIDLNVIGMLGDSVIGAVSEKRATWRHWNLWAEACRQTMGWRFGSTEDREAVVRLIVDAAERQSLMITPPELATSPRVFTHADGTSRFRPRHSTIYSSTELLAAEDRLLARAHDINAPAVDLGVIERLAHKNSKGRRLSQEQAGALTQVAVSGRRIDAIIGPAGAGKTTAMHALRQAWQAEHGKGSVVGLAPSAVAAQVLEDDLGIACENTAKWLYEHDQGRTKFHAGQLVIIDEATLAGTLALDRITGLAEAEGAKVLLVGDWAQLQSVDAGGAFSLLVEARDDTPTLTEVRRFTHEWEKTASLDLRFGRTEVLNTYVRHGRVQEGSTAQMIDAAYLGWRTDTRAGRDSILVTESAHSVVELNSRARAERILDGDTEAGSEVRLGDGTHASVGDLIVTRRNDRRLTPARGGWVRNGDRWRVAAVGRDGTLHVERTGVRLGGAVTLPAAYVAENVDLGYAVTAHRAQGVTVDTAHVVVSSSTTRENLYVSMTRGRDSNISYVALDQPDDAHSAPGRDEVSGRSILHGVLRHSGAELSAHQSIKTEQDRWTSIAQLAAEYETIAAVAQRDRWTDLLASAGLTDDQLGALLGSDSFGPLTAELRRAEANNLNLESELPRLITRRTLADADDIGAVLISRIQQAEAQASTHRRKDSQRLIAGLIPRASGAMAPDMAEALIQRQHLIETRVSALAEASLAKQKGWLTRLGTPPAGGRLLERWLQELRTVIAYRDRYAVDSDVVLGNARSDAQRLDHARAAQAIRRARTISDEACDPSPAVDPRTAVRGRSH